jgi:hypothetical protein
MMFAMCLDTMFVVLSSVLLLITLTMFSVRSDVKCHVNVITCCDKFVHDFSSSIKIHCDALRE